IEGEVIHVIVQQCHDFSKLLRQLTAIQQDPQVLTLAYADEKSIPTHAQHKRPNAKEIAQENIFPDARNFK
ncbi:MAG: hypothetical protein ABIU77_07310, partial [Ferruginibacter sp.]